MAKYYVPTEDGDIPSPAWQPGAGFSFLKGLLPWLQSR